MFRERKEYQKSGQNRLLTNYPMQKTESAQPFFIKSVQRTFVVEQDRILDGQNTTLVIY